MLESIIKPDYTLDQKINLVIAISTFILAFIAFVGLVLALASFKIISAILITLTIFTSIFIISFMIVRWIKK